MANDASERSGRDEFERFFLEDDIPDMERRLFMFFLHTFWQRGELETPSPDRDDFFDTMVSLTPVEPAFKERLVKAFNYVSENMKQKTPAEKAELDATMADYDAAVERNRAAARQAPPFIPFF